MPDPHVSTRPAIAGRILLRGISEEGYVRAGPEAEIDCIPCFGDTVASIGLLSSCMMLFTRSEPAAQVPVFVEPRSLLVMQGEARYQWKHAIPARKVDEIAGMRIARGRRISLTFRTILVDTTP